MATSPSYAGIISTPIIAQISAHAMISERSKLSENSSKSSPVVTDVKEVSNSTAQLCKTTLNMTENPNMPTCNALVVGAGIIGLTSALELHANGHKVAILTNESPLTIFNRTSTSLRSSSPGVYTSSGSGGFWMPFVAQGEHLPRWATVTYERLCAEARSGVSCGMNMHTGFILRATHFPNSLPWYASLAKMERVLQPEDSRIPSSYFGALRFETPIAHMDEYLPHLLSRAKQAGISIMETGNDASYESACAYALQVFGRESAAKTVIVNCTGVGARKFSSDVSVMPGRGVTIRVAAPANTSHFITEDIEDPLISNGILLAYALPRGRHEYTLGGTLFQGEQAWSIDATDDEVDGVRERAAKVITGVQDAKEIARWTGLRPLREQGVRLERERARGVNLEELPVVANYGHGGSGVTLCWGCAADVAVLAPIVAHGSASTMNK